MTKEVLRTDEPFSDGAVSEVFPMKQFYALIGGPSYNPMTMDGTLSRNCIKLSLCCYLYSYLIYLSELLCM